MGGRNREGVIVAGGFSTRFGGTDKAVADLAGTPMIRRVADGMAPAVDTLVVNCREEQRGAIADALGDYELPVRFATDPVPDEGPTAGIRTGLRAVETAYAAVVACDMPFVDPDLLAYLFDRAAGHDGAVPRVDGWDQPTQAVYRAAAMADACEAALAAGQRRVGAATDRLDVVTVAPDELWELTEPHAFENVNTREDLAAARRRLG